MVRGRGLLVLALALALANVAGCVDDYDWIEVEGRVVVQGRVADPVLEFWALDESGMRGDLLERRDTVFYTGGNVGDFFYEEYEQTSPSKCLLLEVIEGTYFDRVSNESVDLTASQALRSVICDATVGHIGEIDSVTVTPLTTIAADRALALAAEGVDLETAVASSCRGVEQQYLLADLVHVLAIDPGEPDDVEAANRTARQHGLVLGGLAVLARDADVTAADFARGIADDGADGLLDGHSGGAAVVVPTRSGGSYSFISTTPTGDLQNAITTFGLEPTYNATNMGRHVINYTPVPLGNPDGSLRITNAVLPAWVSGQQGSYTLTTEGGQGDCGWDITSGELPEGFGFDHESGTISGSATLPPNTTMIISAPFTVAVTCGDESHSLQFTITLVKEPPEVTTFPIQLSDDRDYTVDLDELQLIEATGDNGPYRYALDTGCRLPFGMKLDRYTGRLYGGPYEYGEFRDIRVCAIDIVGSATCAEAPTIVVRHVEQHQDDNCSPSCTGDEVCVSARTCIDGATGCECAGSDQGQCVDYVAEGFEVRECGVCNQSYTACCPGYSCINGSCQLSSVCP